MSFKRLLLKTRKNGGIRFLGEASYGYWFTLAGVEETENPQVISEVLVKIDKIVRTEDINKYAKRGYRALRVFQLNRERIFEIYSSMFGVSMDELQAHRNVIRFESRIRGVKDTVELGGEVLVTITDKSGNQISITMWAGDKLTLS